MGCWPAGPGSRQLGTCFQPQKNACLLGHFLSFQTQKRKLFFLQLNCFPGLNIEIRERPPQILGLGQFGRKLLSLHRSPQGNSLGWEVTRLEIHLFFPLYLWGSSTLNFSPWLRPALSVAAVLAPREVLGHTEPSRGSALTTGCVPGAEVFLCLENPLPFHEGVFCML